MRSYTFYLGQLREPVLVKARTWFLALCLVLEEHPKELVSAL